MLLLAKSHKARRQYSLYYSASIRLLLGCFQANQGHLLFGLNHPDAMQEERGQCHNICLLKLPNIGCFSVSKVNHLDKFLLATYIRKIGEEFLGCHLPLQRDMGYMEKFPRPLHSKHKKPIMCPHNYMKFLLRNTKSLLFLSLFRLTKPV